MSKDNPERIGRDRTIVELRLQGKAMSEIAREMDCSKDTVSRVLRDKDMKAILEAGTQEIIASVPRAVANIQGFLKDSDKQLKYKASKDILEMANIAPGKVQNNYIQTIYQQNNTQIVAPEVLKAMAAFVNQDVDEAEIIDDEGY